MPYQSSPEEDFEFDASTGTITGYTGEAVDVVVPRTIGGKPVRVIGYHAFDAAKDYTDTEMSTNRTEWVHIRSIVIPDTVRTIEDNALPICSSWSCLSAMHRLRRPEEHSSCFAEA